ncbi:hypothetical protein [Smaragdicoccus niigatensis]|uniref:hypothetical protein n=1 Tax=Smaragdicoccus niigatensis TaxID=359359 RepID=UPI00037F575B|nr:hypothetical protein [Smaragdicoccus niigatensis]
MHIDGLRPFLDAELSGMDPASRVAAAGRIATQLNDALDHMRAHDVDATKAEVARMEGVVLALNAIAGT